MSGRNFRRHAAMSAAVRRLLAVALVAGLALWGVAVWRQFDGLLRGYAAVWGGDVASRGVNAALVTVLKDAPRLETVTADSDGRVRALSVDGIGASRLKAAVALAISENMSALAERDGAVPLGTLLGSHLLRGRGPQVRFRLTPVGSAQVELTSRFVEAGINQTCHQLVLSVRVTVGVLLPGASVDRTVGQEAILSETVIVGETPPVYLTTQ